MTERLRFCYTNFAFFLTVVTQYWCNFAIMNRRKFCKILGISTLSAMACPADAAASLARTSVSQRCRITVLRRECYTDLQSRYLDDPEAGPCHMFKCGDEFTVDLSNYDEFSSGRRFCPKAWQVLHTHVDAVLNPEGGDACGISLHDRAVIVSCPDGTRPVIFKVTPDD